MAAKKSITKFTYDGMDFECDTAAIRDYRVQKAIAMGEKNPIAYYEALSTIFCGRDEEYAAMVGGDMEKMGELFVAAIEAAGAKN